MVLDESRFIFKGALKITPSIFEYWIGNYVVMCSSTKVSFNNNFFLFLYGKKKLHVIIINANRTQLEVAISYAPIIYYKKQNSMISFVQLLCATHHIIVIRTQIMQKQ